ncbi:hypothetical protein [Rhizobium sp. IMFF44]|uniref:hypothetical protein n=1 Tax=Rhizobium sp. IMFF44 TaxID=3342350 RepID=UPI0035B83C4A
MNNMLPIVEQLADCRTHAERADWLMRCPNFIFHRDPLVLRRILHAAGLMAGAAYVDAKLAEQTATRLADGSLPITIRANVHAAEVDLKIAARKGGGP